MNYFLLLAVAGVLTTGAAQAQTVAPGTAPGAQTGNPSNMPSAGSTDPISSPDRMNNASGTDRSTKKTMPKGSKLKANSDGTRKSKTKL